MLDDGAVAQMGEHMTGSHEARGSIPLSSTSKVIPFHILRFIPNFTSLHKTSNPICIHRCLGLLLACVYYLLKKCAAISQNPFKINNLPEQLTYYPTIKIAQEKIMASLTKKLEKVAHTTTLSNPSASTESLGFSGKNIWVPLRQ